MTALLLTNFMFAQQTSKVTVHVKNIKNDKGSMMVGLYTEKTFLKASPDFGEMTAIKGDSCTVTFENVPVGTYGISSYHDENGNKTLDTDANGMPTEEYGLSNNPPKMGYPQWSDVKFKVDQAPKELTIKI